MVEIEYLPTKKITIHEIIKNPYNDFLRLFSFPGNQVASRWIDGVLFHISHYPKTPEVVRDNVQGFVHWEVLNFTKLEVFQEQVIDEKTKRQLTIVNNTTNSTVSEVIVWLKKQPIWKD